MESKLDWSKNGEKTQRLIDMRVLLLDEVSMLDEAFFEIITKLLGLAHSNRRGAKKDADEYGDIHLLLFGDFKQLPPATSRAPFIVLPRVYQTFGFRVLKQNRRVVTDSSRQAEIEEFHRVLSDISYGEATNSVRKFVVDSYVRGAKANVAELVPFEGSTAVFAKRKFRDQWNRKVVKRVAQQEDAKSLKIKARVKPRGQQGNNCYGEKKVQALRRKTRTQSLWLLQLAGHHHASYDLADGGALVTGVRHCMRAMLNSNIAVENRFANGTQGRLIYWEPGQIESKKAIPSTWLGLMARFVKESAANKQVMLPEVDFIDITPRAETLMTRGEPVLYQLTVVPSYALTVHKTQAMSIKHVVLGSLEGIFALGQVYVLISRVTDPANFHLVGVPPKDLLEAVAAALRGVGLDCDEVFNRAVGVSNEWRYNPDRPWDQRFYPAYIRQRQVPPTHKSIDEILKPQVSAAIVISRLLRWIERVDEASKTGAERPPFCDEDGGHIFPPEGDPEEKWWLTELSRRKEEESVARRADEDGPPSSDESGDDKDAELIKKDEAQNEELTEDESEDGDTPPDSQLGVQLPLKKKHKPSNLWTASSSGSLGGTPPQ